MDEADLAERIASVARRGTALERPLRCIDCGYCLRGLDQASECPECGAPVEATTLAPYLRSVEIDAGLPDGVRRRLVRFLIVTATVAVIVGLILGIAALL